jgi:uncharacterized protein
MNVKSCTGFKLASGSAETGEFEAIISVFNVKDRDGDATLPGAFVQNFNEWKNSGDPMPVYWSHRMDDPRFSIGRIIEAGELYPGDKRMPEWVPEVVKTNGGSWVRGRLDVGPDASDVAIATRRLLMARLVKQFSYAYTIKDAQWITLDGEDVQGLKRLEIHEVSITQVGSNEFTQLIAAKSCLDEATREPNSPPTGTVVELSTEPGGNEDDGKPESGATKVEEPERAKPEESEPQLDAATVRLLSEGQRLALDL